MGYGRSCRPWLLLFGLATMMVWFSSDVDAFCVRPSMVGLARSARQTSLAPPQKRPLFVSSSTPDDEEDDSDDTTLLQAANTNKNDDDNNLFWKEFQTIHNQFWDYTVNFFYIFISCLILLNVCGFGYSFSWPTMEDPTILQVVPIEQMRQDYQWNYELHRGDNTVTNSIERQLLQGDFYLDE